jgi:hypothetical protein
MELIDKLFWTSVICALISFYLIKYTKTKSGALQFGIAFVFLVSSLALVALAFAKIWA